MFLLRFHFFFFLINYLTVFILFSACKHVPNKHHHKHYCNKSFNGIHIFNSPKPQQLPFRLLHIPLYVLKFPSSQPVKTYNDGCVLCRYIVDDKYILYINISYNMLLQKKKKCTRYIIILCGG